MRVSRGKKLDLFIGADIDDSWAQVQSPRKTTISNEILEPSKHFLVFKKEKRSGFINRKKGKVTNTCILPSLNPSQVVYLEVNEKKFKALGNSNNWSMQCVRSANPDAGALSEKESAQEHAKVGFLSQKEMMLHCGNSEGIKECAKGSNSTRARAWKKKLAKNGKKMISVLATKSPNAPKGGEKLYCQYYNSSSGKSLFAFEYIRTK